MRTFYKTLINAFESPENKARYTEKGLPHIKIIDFYNGQDFNPEYFDVLTLPALYVSMHIDYTTQTPVLALDFRLLFEQLRNTSNRSLSLEQALLFFDLADITDTIITNIKTPYTGTIKKLEEGLEPEPTVTDVYPLSYQCNYYGKTKTPKKDTSQEHYDTLEIEKGLFKSV